LHSLKRISVLSDVKAVYSFNKKLGEGSFGRVYLGMKKKDKKEVAIKTIDKSRISQKYRDVKCLVREVELLRLLDHPGIVKLYEVYEGKEHIYLIMEYIKGGNLLSHLKQIKTYTEKDAAFLIMEVLEVLDYCHSKNIMHQDLKPENLMIEYKFN
jgi:serine/threonine protein kinase